MGKLEGTIILLGGLVLTAAVGKNAYCVYKEYNAASESRSQYEASPSKDGRILEKTISHADNAVLYGFLGGMESIIASMAFATGVSRFKKK